MSLVPGLIELNQPLGLFSPICILMLWLGIVLRSFHGPLQCVILVDWSVEMSCRGYMRSSINLSREMRGWVGRLWGRQRHKMRLSYAVVCKNAKMKCVGMIHWVVWCGLEALSLRLMAKDGWSVLEPIKLFSQSSFLIYIHRPLLIRTKTIIMTEPFHHYPRRTSSRIVCRPIIKAALQSRTMALGTRSLISHMALIWLHPQYWSFWMPYLLTRTWNANRRRIFPPLQWLYSDSLIPLVSSFWDRRKRLCRAMLS